MEGVEKGDGGTVSNSRENDSSVSVQAVNIDFYNESADIADELNHQYPHPVIRLYGSLRDGTRACVHIHGVFPYLYFRPEDMSDPMFESCEQVSSYVDIIEKAIEVGVSDLKKKANSEWKVKKVVRCVTVELKKTMYGYYKDAMPFVRVSLWRPQDVPHVSSALQLGILGRVMQPYEAHVPYLLQFAMDYDVPGMGWLTATNAMVRPRRERKPTDRTNPEPSVATTITGNKNMNDIDNNTARACPDGSEIGSGLLRQPSLLQDITYSQLMWSQDPFQGERDKADNGTDCAGASSSVDKGDNAAAVDEGGATVCISDRGAAVESAAIQKYSYLFRPSVLPMTSTCEVELDIHAQFIVSEPSEDEDDKRSQHGGDNSEMTERVHVESVEASEEHSGVSSGGSIPLGSAVSEATFAPSLSHVRSLADIWREESNRRKEKGLPPDSNTTPPYTDTLRRDVGQFEQEFAVRRDRLLQLARERVRAESTVSVHSLPGEDLLHPGRPEDELLTQAVHSGDISRFPSLSARSNEEVLEHRHVVSLHPHCAMGEMDAHLLEDDEECWATQRIQEEGEIQAILSTCSNPDDGLDPNVNKQHADTVNKPDCVRIFPALSTPSAVVDQLNASTGLEVNIASAPTHDVPMRVDSSPSSRRSGASRSASHTLLSSLGESVAGTAGVVKGIAVKRTTSERIGVVETHSPLNSSGGNETLAPTTPTTACATTKASSDQSSPVVGVGGAAMLSPFTSFMSNFDNPSPMGADSAVRPKGILSSTRKRSRPIHRETSTGVKRLSFSFGSTEKEDSSSRYAGMPAHGVGGRAAGRIELAYEQDTRSSLPISSHLKNSGVHTIYNDTNIKGRSGSIALVPPFHPPLRSMVNEDCFIAVHEKGLYSRQSTSDIESFLFTDLTSTSDSSTNSTSNNIFAVMPGIIDILVGVGGRPARRSRWLVPSFHPPSLAAILKDSDGAEGNQHEAHGRRSRMASQLMTPTQTQPANATAISMKVHNRIKKDNDVPIESTNTDRVNSTSDVVSVAQRHAKPLLITMSLELYCDSRRDLLPNPKVDTDRPRVAMYEVVEANYTADSEDINRYCGCVVLLEPPSAVDNIGPSVSDIAFKRAIKSALIPLDTNRIFIAHSEQDFFTRFISIVRKTDPDYLIGYDVQGASWGWLIGRAGALKPPVDLIQGLGRVPDETASHKNEHDIYGEEHESGIWITGRTVINVWRRMKDELKLNRYTIQSTAAHVLKKRLPEFTNQQLNHWFQSPKTIDRVLKHLYRLVSTSIDLVDSLDLIRRTAESASLYGIDFFSVLTRGSQYRVEAVMLRVAHKLGYIAMSPSKEQVAQQAAMEVIPLVMEPESDFYTEPVVVLDFQSLYPSMICAYNLCFSTIMGKLSTGSESRGRETTGRLGASTYNEDATVDGLRRHAFCTDEHSNSSASCGSSSAAPGEVDSFISPNGSLFAHPAVRKGILPLMLQEILDTRQMVKRSMKLHKGPGGEVLQRVLDARQLALKMIANVTYGYTAAGFSGRMPMAELADAVVQCGRSTLEAAIRHIEGHPTWRARVVYGDTDSVFVLMKGRSKDEAFALGHQIARDITEMNPKEVVLKFEKVYLPCVLVSKKRYVGYCYESEEQEEGHLDAKGIEMVRRDNCLATTKLQEKVLRILFTTKNLSFVKAYLMKQWTKISIGLDKVPLKDFMFSKEVRLGHYATGPSGAPKNLPPGAVVAHKAMLYDPMVKPPYRWRVPYVVCIGEPGARLKDLVVDPHEVLRSDGNLRINHTYYITKMILPALRRLLVLAGVDVEQWYRDMAKPAPRLRRRMPGSVHVPGQLTITSFMQAETCVICKREYKANSNSNNGAAPYSNMKRRLERVLARGRVCEQCLARPELGLTLLQYRLQRSSDSAIEYSRICSNCSKHRQHVVVPKYDRKGDATEEIRTGVSSKPKDPYAHIFKAGGKEHSTSSSSASSRTTTQALEIESCMSLDCALFYEKCKIKSKHDELVDILSCAEEAVQMLL